MSEAPLYGGALPTTAKGPAVKIWRSLVYREKQGYLAHERMHYAQTLQQAYAYGPMVVLGKVAFSYERGAL